MAQKSPRVGPLQFLNILDEEANFSTVDGVTVAKAVVLKDKFENLGAR